MLFPKATSLTGSSGIWEACLQSHVLKLYTISCPGVNEEGHPEQVKLFRKLLTPMISAYTSIVINS